MDAGTTLNTDRSAGTRLHDLAAKQVVPYTAAVGESTAISALEVMLWATTDCYVHHSQDGVDASAANSIPLTAKVPLYVQIAWGDIISALRVSADGSLHIVPVA